MLDANSFPAMPNLLTNPFSRQEGNQGYAIFVPGITDWSASSLKNLTGLFSSWSSVSEYRTDFSYLGASFTPLIFKSISELQPAYKFIQLNKKPFSSTERHILHHYSFECLEKVNKAVTAHLLMLLWGYVLWRFESTEYFFKKICRRKLRVPWNSVDCETTEWQTVDETRNAKEEHLNQVMFTVIY